MAACIRMAQSMQWQENGNRQDLCQEMTSYHNPTYQTTHLGMYSIERWAG